MARNSTKNNKAREITKNNTKEKQSWEVEFWSWTSSMLRWISDAILNCLAAWWEWVMSWVSKLSEKLWSKDPEVVSNKQQLTVHHVNQMKKSLNRAKHGVLKVGKWVYHTTVWAIKTVLASWKDTINWLREEEKTNIVEMPKQETSKSRKKAA